MRMGYTIDSMYSSTGSVSGYNRINYRQLNYTLNNIFQRFLKVSIRGNNVEVPIFARSVIQPKVYEILHSESPLREDIIIHLPCADEVDIHKSATTFRTVDSMLKHLMGNPSTIQNMYNCAKTNHGDIYYGGSGTLFNKDMVPIFFNVLIGDIENHIITYKKVRTYIHPSVFYSNGIVEKCIVNKIIPYVLQNGVYINEDCVRNQINYNSRGIYSKAIPEIVVADIGDRFFCKPITPNVNYTDDSLNATLDRNIDDVFRIMGI